MYLADINRVTSMSGNPNGRNDDPATLPDPRILIISVSPDQSSSYIPVMNSIFSAQKLVSCLLRLAGLKD
jgi:transcription initiation factor TFIIH subunit 3